MTKVEQPLSMREDIQLLPAFVAVFCETGDSPEERLKIFESARNYMLYFEGFALGTLRHNADEEFSGFFHDLHTAKQVVVAGRNAGRAGKRQGTSGYCSKAHRQPV